MLQAAKSPLIVNATFTIDTVDAMSTPLCLPLSDVSAADLAIAGGKGANLGELVNSGFNVPAGFVVTTPAYRSAIAEVAAPSRGNVLEVPVPPQVRADILAAYSALGHGLVAVRSSATAEDLPGATFAGQQDTLLGVVGDDELLDAVRNCWASLWTERAISYRQRLGIEPSSVAIAVVVQRMVPADQAGVMFTANPVTGARDQVVIDSNPGLGEAVVAGLVTPDHAVLDADGHIAERRAGRRETVIRAGAAGGTETFSAQNASAKDIDPISAADLARLAEVGRRIESHFGRPQDIEWAIAGDELAILQARPMTALPPPPIPLNRFQRFVGQVVLELLPRRPYPMELTAWITLTVGPIVERLGSGLVGVSFDFADVVPAEDGVVQAFVPPRPHPTAMLPVRVIRSIARMGRDPGGWADDPVELRYVAQASRLSVLDVTRAAWAELLEIPTAAARLTDLVTDLRVEYLPAAGGALLRLRLLLKACRLDGLFGDLIVDAPTITQEANDTLTELARRVRNDQALSRAFADQSGEQLLDFVESAVAADGFRERFSAFLDRFGHRETASILLLRDPTWRESPTTVLALIKVLAGEAPTEPRPATSRAALDRLLAHPLVRRTRSQDRVRRLVAKAAAGTALREDTHYEATRLMPVVYRAVVEIGVRLAEAGALGDPDDVWYLTWPEVSVLADPARTAPGETLRESVQRRRAAYAELAGAPLIATATLFPDRANAEDALVAGVGGGGGRAAGPVRVIRTPDDFDLLQSGDVLVCTATNPSWTPLFARAAAVVVDFGGLASHAAIVAREYGIPAVMGCVTGTTALADGRRVLVDGDRGVVLPTEGERGADHAGL